MSVQSRPLPETRPRAVPKAETPWQLRMFSKTLKKKQKLDLLLRQIGDTRGKRCLLVTQGDNNGALHYLFRANGGEWTWVENEHHRIPEMRMLLGEPVLPGGPSRIPVEDASFDVVVTIDVHEHLPTCDGFNAEIARVAKPGGMVVVTTPGDGPWKPVNVLKRMLGMGKEAYGHVVLGYSADHHRNMLSPLGLRPVSAGGYSRFFTELIELGINFAYVKVLSKRSKAKVEQGVIAPSSARQFLAVKKQYRIYAATYPLLFLITRLDRLLFLSSGYAVSVVFRKAT